MAENLNISAVQIDIPEDANVIVGQSHFIKTVEDIYEAMATAAPDCLIRHDGNNAEMEKCAIENAQKMNAGHTFIIVMRKGYPINVLNRIKDVQEVCRIFAATANPLQVLVAESEQGRGIIGVIDGFPTKGVEDEKGAEWRVSLLRDIIGYKR